MEENISASSSSSSVVSSSEYDDIMLDMPRRDPWDMDLSDLQGSYMLHKNHDHMDARDEDETELFLSRTEDLLLIKPGSSFVRMRALKSYIQKIFFGKSNHYRTSRLKDVMLHDENYLYCDMLKPAYCQVNKAEVRHERSTAHTSHKLRNVFLKYSIRHPKYEQLPQDVDLVDNNTVPEKDSYHDGVLQDKPSDKSHDHGLCSENGDLFTITKNRMTCPIGPHSIDTVLEIFEQVQLIKKYVGQAFGEAYTEFLNINGIEDPHLFKDLDYQDALQQQQIYGEELFLFSKTNMKKEVVLQKLSNEVLGMVIVESGWGSLVPTVVVAKMSPTGAAARSKQLNIGDNILAINGRSLVGLSLPTCKRLIEKAVRQRTIVSLCVVSCPPVIEVCIRRPDIKYQLGFSLHNGVVCSLLRGGIGERGGVRVGHRIIEVNNQSVVAVPHDKLVGMLASSVGEISMKTIQATIFRLLTEQEIPRYI